MFIGQPRVAEPGVRKTVIGASGTVNDMTPGVNGTVSGLAPDKGTDKAAALAKNLLKRQRRRK